MVHCHIFPSVYNKRKNRILVLMKYIWDASGDLRKSLAGGTICPGNLVVITDKTGTVGIWN